MTDGEDERRGGSPEGSLFTVGAASAGLRLDAFVGRSLSISAAAARRLIAAGKVRLDRRLVAKGTSVSAGAEVQILSRIEGPAAVLPDAEVEISVVYRDEHLVAVDKPAGLPSHPLRPGERRTAANAIVARFPECASASPDPREGGLGHRLDTATSGVLIAARSREAWSALRSALGGADCEKRYLCEVEGAPPDAGRIDAEIGRSGRRGGVVRVGGGRRPQTAETSWTVLARARGSALVEARLHAGRAHQVRAHLAAAGYPLVGDDRYGGAGETVPAFPSVPAPSSNDHPRAGARDGSPRRDNTSSIAQLHLHALSVRLRHPVTGVVLLIAAPAPHWATHGWFDKLAP